MWFEGFQVTSVLSSASETKRFGSLSVQHKDVSWISAPSITTEDILLFIRQIVQCDIQLIRKHSN